MKLSGPGAARLLFHRVYTEMKDSADPQTLAFLEAVKDGRFYFEREQWFSLDNCLMGSSSPVPCEMLLRPYDESGVLLPTSEAVFRRISEAGHHCRFDTAVIISAVDQAIREECFPISVNASALVSEDPDFGVDLDMMLTTLYRSLFDPRDIVIEYTEDASAENVDVESICAMRDRGYRFAIDDLSHQESDLRRLMNLGPYVDFVKIDGRTNEAKKSGNVKFDQFIDTIRRYAPNADIVTEWVQTPLEASLLRQHYGVAYVTGRELDRSEDAFSEQVRQAWNDSMPGKLGLN